MTPAGAAGRHFVEAARWVPIAAILLAGTAFPMSSGAAPPASESIESYDISVRAAMGDPALSVEALVRFAVDPGRSTLTVELPRSYAVREVLRDGVAVKFRRSGDRIRIQLPGGAGESPRLTFRYAWPLGLPLGPDTLLVANAPWYPVLPANEAAASLRSGEAGARISVTLPAALVAISAGSYAVEPAHPEVRHVWQRETAGPFHPLVIGTFEARRIEHAGRPVYAFIAGRASEAVDPALRHAAEAVGFFSQTFADIGLDQYSVIGMSLPSGLRGLTLPGLSILPLAELLQPTEDSHRITAHEIAHNWWSYGVDVSETEDAWLHEGLPTYSAILLLERQHGASRLAREMENSRRIALAAVDGRGLGAGSPAGAGASNYGRNYHRAACVLHMLRELAGAGPFSAALGGIFRDYRGKRLDTAGFRREVARALGDDAARLIDYWLVAPAVPSITVEYAIDRVPGTNGHAVVGRILHDGDEGVVGPLILSAVSTDGSTHDHRALLQARETPFSFDVPFAPVDLAVDPRNDFLRTAVVVLPLGGADP